MLEHQNELELLNLLACEPDTEKAFIPTAVVEELCKRAIEKWCTNDPKQLRNFNEITKQCVIVILPKVANHDVATHNFTQLMKVGQETNKKKNTKKKKVNSELSVFDQD
jgi:hypothetical protein